MSKKYLAKKNTNEVAFNRPASQRNYCFYFYLIYILFKYSKYSKKLYEKKNPQAVTYIKGQDADIIGFISFRSILFLL